MSDFTFTSTGNLVQRHERAPAPRTDGQQNVSGREKLQVGTISATPGDGNNKRGLKQDHLDQRMAAGDFHV